MAKISWTLYKETFQPDKNYFTKEPVQVSRDESKFEIENNKLGDLIDTAGTLLLVLSSVLVVLSGICLVGVLANEPKYCLACLGIFIPSLLCAFFIPKLCFKASDKYYALAYKYCEENDVWNTPLAKEIKAYNAEQELIAAEWRAKHPLEEKIRACIKDPKSSVEIADLARFYAKEYLLMEKNNETLD